MITDNSNKWSGNDRIFKTYCKGSGKRCIEKHTDVDYVHSWDEVQRFSSFGGILQPDVIDISFDDPEMSKTVLKLAKLKHWDTMILRNPEDGHIHTFWRIPKGYAEKDGHDIPLACGLIADVHHNGTYIPLRVSNVERFPPIYDNDEYQEFPVELYPVNTTKRIWHMEDGGGRNQDLFEYILVLQNQLELTKSEIREMYRNVINPYILGEPLDESELNTILRDDAFKQVPSFFKKNKFQFYKMADYLIRVYKIYEVNGELAIPVNHRYTTDRNEIEKVMLRLVPSLSQRDRKEVLSDLALMCEKKTESDPKYIGFQNGVLDVETMRFYHYSDKEFIFMNTIPWNYNPDAYDELLDQTIDQWMCGDKTARALFEECIGYCCTRSTDCNTAFIFKGEKANGKSTAIKVISHMMGSENISALDLSQMQQRFFVAELQGKLANLGDDIGDEYIQDASLFRKITGGSAIQADRKGRDAFKFKPYATLIFSANNIPRMNDPTGAVKRRLTIIPFNATFTRKNKEYDPHIVEKLTTQNATEYLIRIAMEGLRRVFLNKGFTIAKAAEDELKAYEVENNPILGFINDTDEDEIINQDTRDVYTEYVGFCNQNGYKSCSKITFSKQLNRALGTHTKNFRDPGTKKTLKMFVR